MTNTLIVGASIVVLSGVAFFVPFARKLTAIPAGWMLMSALSMAHVGRAATLSNTVVAIAVLLTSVVPSGPRGQPGERNTTVPTEPSVPPEPAAAPTSAETSGPVRRRSGGFSKE